MFYHFGIDNVFINQYFQYHRSDNCKLRKKIEMDFVFFLFANHKIHKIFLDDLHMEKPLF